MADLQNNPGNASVNGDVDQDPGQSGTGNSSAQENGSSAQNNTTPEKTVPYARFQQVNEQKKAAEETLKALAEEAFEEVPENMRELIPDLSPALQIKWIRMAMKKGLFGGNTQKNGPDAERPGGKPPQNYEGMHPYAVMAQGYKS